MRYALDTHVLLKWASPGRALERAHSRIIAKATPETPLLVPDICLWEIALLRERGRITFDIPFDEWITQIVSPPLVSLCPITPQVATELLATPITAGWDPGDRIIVATARVHGATLLTQDERIIKSKIVKTI